MKYLVLLFIPVFMFNCAGVKETTDRGKEDQTEISGQYDESFDPLSLDDDDIDISKQKENAREPSPPSDQPSEDVDATTSESREIDGWRVQILATKNIENATLVHQEASDQFALSNLKTYLIFEAPLYKVRIGNAESRSEAEVIRDLARDYGYAEAFIVRSKIIADDTSEPDLE